MFCNSYAQNQSAINCSEYQNSKRLDHDLRVFFLSPFFHEMKWRETQGGLRIFSLIKVYIMYKHYFETTNLYKINSAPYQTSKSHRPPSVCFYLGFIATKLDFVTCEQQRCRSVYAPRRLICAFVISSL